MYSIKLYNNAGGIFSIKGIAFRGTSFHAARSLIILVAPRFVMAVLFAASILGLITFGFASEVTEVGSNLYPLGDPRNCEVGLNADSKFFRMEVLPGLGWDNLRNLDQSIILAYNYSQCKTTNDRKFLIPDDTFVIPQQRSAVATYSEITDHIFNYTSMTSTTINAHASFGPIGGKFSAEYQHAKGHFYNDGSSLSRIQLRYLKYVIKSSPDAQLNPAFKSRLWEIASEIQGQNKPMARYLAELLIRDYGTHYVHTTSAGAILAQEDFLKSSYVSDFSSDRSKITASAHESFFGNIGMSVTHKTQSSTTQSYLNNITYSHTVTYGGPPFRANFSLDQWEDGLDNALVAIDRDGDPLFYVITPQNVPEIPPFVLFEVTELVKQAIASYYTHNTYSGCPDPTAQNFDYKANVDDSKSCKAVADNFTFGGVYQTCEVVANSWYSNSDCDSLLQKNPLTQDYKCPEDLGYTQVVLHVGYKSRNIQWSSSCGFLGWGRCSSRSVLRVRYTTWWCVALGKVPPQTGLLFGGVYTSTKPNPVTHKLSCPDYFQDMRFGLNGHVCVSNDYELGLKYAEPFAGFDSCTVGNPLAVSLGLRSTDPSKWPKFHCPSGYSQHLAMVDEDCDINYCIKSGILTEYGSTAVKRPPFVQLPTSVADNTPVGLFTTDGQLIVKNKADSKPENLDWSVVPPSKELFYEILENTGVVNETEIETFRALHLIENATVVSTSTAPKQIASSTPEATPTSDTEMSQSDLSPQASGLSAGAAAGIGITSTIVVGVLVLAAFLVGMKVNSYRTKKQQLSQNTHEVTVGYQSLNTNHEPPSDDV